MLDAESLSQIERIVTSATDSLRREIAATAIGLRQEIAASATGLREDLRQEIAASATGLREDLRQEIAASATGLRQDMAAMESRLGDRIEEAKRHGGVLVEGLRHELQLVAEGLQMHIERRHTDDRAYLDEQFQETRALIHLSYGQLHERVERLEQRVRTIEQHLGLSA